jgi:hypothetical protein
MRIVDDRSWKRVLEIWPETLPGLADAAIVAVAAANRYEAVATSTGSYPTASKRSASPRIGSSQ